MAHREQKAPYSVGVPRRWSRTEHPWAAKPMPRDQAGRPGRIPTNTKGEPVR